MPGAGKVPEWGRITGGSLWDPVIMFFRKRKIKDYDKENKKPVLRCSICTGEQVAGFKDLHSGIFEEEMMISNPKDLEAFKEMYGIEGEIEKIY